MMTQPQVDMTSSHNITSGDRLSDDIPGSIELEYSVMVELERSFKDSQFRYTDPLRATLIGVYVVVFLLSVIGNALVIIIIRLDKSNRGIDAYLMLNLAIADLLVAVVCMPLTTAQLVYAVWLYGEFLCKASSYVQGVCIGASVMTIMLLSIDRYLAVRHPVKSRNFSSSSVVIATALCATWAVAGLIMVPLAVMRELDVVKLTSEQLEFCYEDWPSKSARQAFDMLLCVFIYLVPGVVVVASYISTGCTLLSGGHDVELLRRHGDSMRGYERALAGRRRAAVMLLFVAGLFATFWLPYHVVSLYLDFVPSSPMPSSESSTGVEARSRLLSWLASLSLLLGHSHSAQNPIIYFVMSKTFKRDLIALLTCRRVTSHGHQSSLYGDWCRKQSQRSLGSDAGSRHHHHHHNHRHRDNCCRLTETRDQVTHVAADVDAEQVPLPVYDADPDRVRDDVIELNVFP